MQIFLPYILLHWCRVSVGRRSNERKIQARGIYPGAKVTRGPDWQYDNQDGEIGTFGTVKKITIWKENPASAAAVSWENGTESTYRLGYHGKVSTDCDCFEWTKNIITEFDLIFSHQTSSPEIKSSMTD